MSSDPDEEFVCEPLETVPGAFAPMAIGEPALPTRFRWRKAEYEVARVLDKWRTTSRCRQGSPEQYVRRHWYRIVAADGTEMTIYFDRQPRSTRERKKRWWVVSVKRGGSKHERRPARRRP